MGRKTGEIKKTTIEGGLQVVRFWHPGRGKAVRFVLGSGDRAATNLADLNTVLQAPGNALHERCSSDVRDLFGEPGSSQASATPGETVSREVYETLRREYESVCSQLQAEFNAHRITRKQVETALGRKTRKGACPTLAEARGQFMAGYKNRDKYHTANVESMLETFCQKIDPAGDALEVDALDGQERRIDAWISDTPGGASRRHWRRTYVLKFLKYSGLAIDKNIIAAVSAVAIRRDRGGIRWLAREEAEKIAAKLPPPWDDVFRFQVATGLRPTELATIKRGDFSPDFSELTLSAREAEEEGGERFGLKTGSRTIQVPWPARAIVRGWLPKKPAAADVVFVNPATGAPWLRREWFFRVYLVHLKGAQDAAKVLTEVDCRIGRRTCGSLLLRAGKSVEDVAAILGDTPETIRAHYARILSGEVDPSAAAIG